MIWGIPAALLALGLAADGGIPAPGPDVNVAPRPRLVVLPMENLTGGSALTSELEDALETRLRRQFTVVPKDVLQPFMSRHRLRHTGGVDTELAVAARAELGAAYVLVSTLQAYSPGPPPVISLTLRLVLLGDEPEIDWTGNESVAGDQAPGLLRLSVVDDLEVLRDRALDRLMRSMALHLDGSGRPGRLCLGATRYRPNERFRSPLLDDAVAPTVAVIPFLNRTKRRGAGETVALEFTRHLVAAGKYRVLEPGVVRDYLLRARVIMPGGVSVEAARLLAGALEVDVIVSGEVIDFEESGAEGPTIRFSTTMLQGGTGEVLWQSSSFNRGTDGVYFFGLGRVATAGDLTCRMVRGVMDRLLGPATPTVVLAFRQPYKGDPAFSFAKKREGMTKAEYEVALREAAQLEPAGSFAADGGTALAAGGPQGGTGAAPGLVAAKAACDAPLPKEAIEISPDAIQPPLVDRRAGGGALPLMALRAAALRFDMKSGALLVPDRLAFSELAQCAHAKGFDLFVRAVSSPTTDQLSQAAHRTGEVLRLGLAEKLNAERIVVEILTRAGPGGPIDMLVALVPPRGQGAIPAPQVAGAELAAKPPPAAAGEAVLGEPIAPLVREPPSKGPPKPEPAGVKTAAMARAEREARATLSAKDKATAANEREARAVDAARAAKQAREAARSVVAQKVQALKAARAASDARAEREAASSLARAERDARIAEGEARVTELEVERAFRQAQQARERLENQLERLAVAEYAANPQAKVSTPDAATRAALRPTVVPQELEEPKAQAGKSDPVPTAATSGAQEPKPSVVSTRAEGSAAVAAAAGPGARAESTAPAESKAEAEARKAAEQQAKVDAKAEAEARKAAEQQAKVDAKAEAEAHKAAEQQAKADARAEAEVRKQEVAAATLISREESIHATATRLDELEQSIAARDARAAERAEMLEDRAKQLELEESRLSGNRGKLSAIGPDEKQLADSERAQRYAEKRHLASVGAQSATELKLKQQEAALRASATSARSRETSAQDAQGKLDARSERVKVSEGAEKVRELKLDASAARIDAHEKQMAAMERRLAAWAKRLELVGTQQEILRPGDEGKQQIADAVRKNGGDIKRCVESLLKRNPQAIHTEGILKIVVDLRGRVSKSGITGGRLKGSFLDTCIQESARSWRFPMSGEEYELQVPLTIVGRDTAP